MTLHVGYIPYLNMVPFHQGFGPAPLEIAGHSIIFRSCSPRALGIEAERGTVDAGALSLVDGFRLGDQFEPIGNFGIGVLREALSVLLFSKKPIAEFQGTCAVTDETSTSVRLLQVLLEKRYERASGVTYGRIASSALYDGSSDGLLLIGDEALQARRQGIKGLPVVTDLGEEWFAWQQVPFVFARWMVRKSVSEKVKVELNRYLEKSLASMNLHRLKAAEAHAKNTALDSQALLSYWSGFAFMLTEGHQKSITLFEEMIRRPSLV